MRESFWIFKKFQAPWPLCSILHLLNREIFKTINYVVLYSSWKDRSVLINQSYLFSETDCIDLGLRVRAIEYVSGFYLIEFLDEFDDSRFSWATLPDKGNVLSSFDFERKVRKNCSLESWILKSHVFKDDISINYSVLSIPFIDERLVFKHFEDFLNWVSAIDDICVTSSKVGGWVRKTCAVKDERGEFSCCDFWISVYDHTSSIPEDEHDANIG